MSAVANPPMSSENAWNLKVEDLHPEHDTSPKSFYKLKLVFDSVNSGNRDIKCRSLPTWLSNPGDAGYKTRFTAAIGYTPREKPNGSTISPIRKLNQMNGFIFGFASTRKFQTRTEGQGAMRDGSERYAFQSKLMGRRMCTNTVDESFCGITR